MKYIILELIALITIQLIISNNGFQFMFGKYHKSIIKDKYYLTNFDNIYNDKFKDENLSNFTNFFSDENKKELEELEELEEIDNFFQEQDEQYLLEVDNVFEDRYKKEYIDQINSFTDIIFDNEPEIDDTKSLFYIVGNKDKITKDLLYEMKNLQLKFFFFPKSLFTNEILKDVFGFTENSIVRVYKDQQLVGDLFEIYDLLYGLN